MARQVTAAQIAKMRSRAQSAAVYTETADILQPPDPNSATRGSGGFVGAKFPVDWTKLNGTTPEACHVGRERQNVEQLGAGEVQASSAIPIRFRVGVAVNEKCRIKILSSTFNPNLVGRAYDIVGVPQSGIELTQTVLCKLVKPSGSNS